MDNKFLPKKPDFNLTLKNGMVESGPTFQRNLTRFTMDTDILTFSQFNNWYDEEIRPLFENAVEVSCTDMNGNGRWNALEHGQSYPIPRPDTHKALLIKIENLKEETVEDLLRNLIEAPDEQCFSEARVRAKAYLARKK